LKAITFKEASERAHKVRAAGYRNVKHAADWLSSLERFAFPVIGSMPVAEVEVAHVQRVLEPIWEDRTETATRLRQRMESVFSWATVAGFRSGDNPARWEDNLKELMTAPSKIRQHKNYAALSWQQVPGFMDGLRKRKGVSNRALEFAILTAARSGEVRGAKWTEIDLDKKLWTIPADRMKAKKKHEVPLSPEAVRLLSALPRHKSGYVFPAARGGKLSDMSLAAPIKRMHEGEASAGRAGYADPTQLNEKGHAKIVTQHGFRSSFKDWARNETRYPDEVSELALAHVNSDATRAAYARDGLLQQRRKLLEQWAKYCASPVRHASATVTPINRRRA
jgi:integrase